MYNSDYIITYSLFYFISLKFKDSSRVIEILIIIIQ